MVTSFIKYFRLYFTDTIFINNEYHNDDSLKLFYHLSDAFKRLDNFVVYEKYTDICMHVFGISV